MKPAREVADEVAKAFDLDLEGLDEELLAVEHIITADREAAIAEYREVLDAAKDWFTTKEAWCRSQSYSAARRAEAAYTRLEQVVIASMKTPPRDNPEAESVPSRDEEIPKASAEPGGGAKPVEFERAPETAEVRNWVPSFTAEIFAEYLDQIAQVQVTDKQALLMDLEMIRDQFAKRIAAGEDVELWSMSRASEVVDACGIALSKAHPVSIIESDRAAVRAEAVGPYLKLCDYILAGHPDTHVLAMQLKLATPEMKAVAAQMCWCENVEPPCPKGTCPNAPRDALPPPEQPAEKRWSTETVLELLAQSFSDYVDRMASQADRVCLAEKAALLRADIDGGWSQRVAEDLAAIEGRGGGDG